MNAIHVIIFYVFSLFFAILNFILLSYFILTIFNIRFDNPIREFFEKLTSPIVVPLRNFLPVVHKKIDISIICLIILVELSKFILLSFLLTGKFLPFFSILVFSFFDLIIQICQFFFYAVLIQVILNWLSSS